MRRTKRKGMENPQFPLKGVGQLQYITNLNEYSLSLISFFVSFKFNKYLVTYSPKKIPCNLSV